MTGWLALTDTQRRISIDQAAIASGIKAKAIEKDWWMTLVLKALFSLPLSPYFIFKGGTSLSKGWKMIQRFSEDIDIALDLAAFGRTYQDNPSHTFVKTLKKEGCAFTSTTIREMLEKRLQEMGLRAGTVTVVAAVIPDTIPDRDPQTIYVRYHSLYPPHAYLADEVKIEFGVRSLKEPFATVNILSLLTEFFPNPAYAETPFEVLAAEPRKTFLEKMFLLHEKFLTLNPALPTGERQSRHLYDLVKMIGATAEQQALADKDFYHALLDHRRKYVRLKGVEYDTLRPFTLSFLPPDNLLEAFRQDYRVMLDEMIYAEVSPDFDTIMDQLRFLNGKVKMMGEGRTLEEVIDEARSKLQGGYPDKTIMKLLVEYKGDIYQPETALNRFVTYQVSFIQRGGIWRFYSISFTEPYMQ